MNETKYTPGPWQKYDEDGIVGVQSEYFRIAVMDNEDESPQEYDRAGANADLIAAAPVLYEYVRARATAGDAEAARIVEAIHGHS